MSNRKLAGLQALRGVAALAVVFYHLMLAERVYGQGPSLLPEWLAYGAGGVDVFFVLSGFVLALTYRDNISRRFSEAGSFLVKRILRIYPPYWLFSVILLGLILAQPGLVHRSVWQGVNLLRSFLLLPQQGPPLLSVGWALVHLVYFYGVFAGLLVLGPRRLPAALAVWTVFVVAGHLLVRQPGPLSVGPTLRLILNPLTLEFIVGVAAGRMVLSVDTHAWKQTAGHIALAIGILLVLIGLVVQWTVRGSAVPSGWMRLALFGLPAMVIVPGLALCEMTSGLKVSRFLTVVGNASYSLYLSHTLVISALGRAWRKVPLGTAVGHTAWIILALAASLAIGVTAYQAIERPLAGLSWRPGRRRPPAPRSRPTPTPSAE